jgi:predicted esterase
MFEFVLDRCKHLFLAVAFVDEPILPFASFRHPRGSVRSAMRPAMRWFIDTTSSSETLQIGSRFSSLGADSDRLSS